MATDNPYVGTAPVWKSPIVILAYIITFGFFAVLVLLMFAKINPEMKDPLLLMLGALISSFTGIVGYYFGSTNTEARKDATIKELTQTAAVVASTAQAVQVASDATATGSPAIKVDEVKIDATGGSVEVSQLNQGKP